MRNDVSSSAALTRWPLFLLLVAVLWFTTLGTRPLLEPDEGRYAEISREMLVTGDWVTPRLNGLKYFEKPPLQYWGTAIALKVFGLNDFAARFWLGLTGFAAIVLVGFTGARLFGRDVGLMAAAILVSSLMYVVIGHVNTLDMSLSCWFTVMVCGFVLAQHAPLGSRAERHYMWLVWAAAAAAFLTKGLIAFILPGLCLVLYSLICREFSAWRRLHLLTGLPLLLLLCVPWLIAMSLRNPEFLQFFFWHEQFERFLSDSHDRDGPIWYFLPLLALGTLPWTLAMLREAVASWRADAAVTGFQSRRFMALWIITVVGFFSVSHSKLPPYILPIWPMLALLLADQLQRHSAQRLRWQWWIMGALLAVTGGIIAWLPDTVAGTHNIDVVKDLRPETSLGFVVMGATLLFTAWRIGRGISMVNAVVITALGTLLGLTVLIQGSDALIVSRSSKLGAAQIKPQLTADTRLYSVSDYPQSLPFYLERTLTLVNYRGELDFGLTQQPELGVDTIDEFKRAWQQPEPAIAIVSPELLAQFTAQGLPMKTIATQRDWLAIAKP